MYTAKQAEDKIQELKTSGIPLAEAAWKAALLCVGWPYIFGDRGQYCTPEHRRAAYNARGAEHPTIKSKCKNFSGNGTCSGCTFYPGGKTRAFDCRGFPYWVLKQIYNWELMGAGATSQWNTASNWKAKGTIAEGMPKDTLCCLFKANGKTMEHTGFGLNNETVECSSGVQYSKTRNKKWTHWAVPKVIDGKVEIPDDDSGFPDKTGWRATIRRGSKGNEVKECQTMLYKLGYDIGVSGIDGDYGRATEKAVKEFQADHKLTVDGVCGPMTWDALDKAYASLTEKPKEKLYTVCIHHLDKTQADAMKVNYPSCVVTEE